LTEEKTKSFSKIIESKNETEPYICEICGRECKGYRGYISHKRWHDLPEYQKFQKRFRERMKEENNPMWKGNDVKYDALHEWVRRYKKKPKRCPECGKLTTKLDIANISGEYKRDLSDFKYLCRKCHIMRDGVINNLKSQKERIEK